MTAHLFLEMNCCTDLLTVTEHIIQVIGREKRTKGHGIAFCDGIFKFSVVGFLVGRFIDLISMTSFLRPKIGNAVTKSIYFQSNKTRRY